MKLSYRLPAFSHMLDTLCALLEGGVLEGIMDSERSGEFCAETLFQFYPQLDRRLLASLGGEGRRRYLEEIFGEIFRNNERALGDTATRWQMYWDPLADAITAAFEETFDISLDRRLRRVVCNVTLDPSCPRDDENKTFDLFHLNSERGACGLALRELARLAWFEKWHDHFGDSPEDYGSPGLKWIFCAMSTDAVLSHPTLAALNPYNGRSCPTGFYSVRVDGRPLTETLGELRRANTITGYMEKGFRLCIDCERAIRSALG